MSEVNLTLLPGQKLALTGANGTGKSTFFSFLLGSLEADQGSSEGLDGIRIAHMAQDVAAERVSAIDFVRSGDQTLASLLSRLQTQEAESDFEGLAETHTQLEAVDGYARQRQASMIMHRLGFATEDEQRSVADFSGGWRGRLALARALFSPADLLLLDEPTNHLDLDTSLWLQRFLLQRESTVVLISHDRDFIDATCRHVLHIEHGKLDQYKGNYSQFERERAERLAQRKAAIEKQQKQRDDIEAFVRRFRAKATKAKQAQSRLKALARMEELAPVHAASPFSFRFAAPEDCSDPMISLEEGKIGYSSESPLLEDVEIAVRKGDRIGLLGRNGVGKTTLLRTLTGAIAPLAGERVLATRCRIGYFDQQQIDTLDLEASALLHIRRLDPHAREQEIRDYLGRFAFGGEKADRAVDVFSGGEKARLALALIAWQKPNLLILDEPTNHLDIEMRSALELALASFEGAVILVSHDRHLLRSTAERFVHLAASQAVDFDGDLEDYEQLLFSAKEDTPPTQSGSQAPQTKARSQKELRQAAAQARARLKPLQRECEQLEKQVEKLEAKLAALEIELADESLYESREKNRLTELLKTQGTYKSDLIELEERWLEKQTELEALTDPQS
ncbi:MAG: ATP-binding cassette domain-containing protein [Pseudomonadota bacterium]